jgi:CheY-like chemotaxis protein
MASLLPRRYAGVFLASELLRITALVAYVHPDVRKKCFEVGMDEYITEPVRLNELKAVLRKYSGGTA